MEGNIDGSGDGFLPPPPPPRLFDRLAQLSGYTWDQSIEPFHSVSPWMSSGAAGRGVFI